MENISPPAIPRPYFWSDSAVLRWWVKRIIHFEDLPSFPPQREEIQGGGGIFQMDGSLHHNVKVLIAQDVGLRTFESVSRRAIRIQKTGNVCCLGQPPGLTAALVVKKCVGSSVLSYFNRRS
jgi:hypothetical protein